MKGAKGIEKNKFQMHVYENTRGGYAQSNLYQSVLNIFYLYWHTFYTVVHKNVQIKRSRDGKRKRERECVEMKIAQRIVATKVPNMTKSIMYLIQFTLKITALK